MTTEEAIIQLQLVRRYPGRMETYERGKTMEIVVEYLQSIGEWRVADELQRTSDCCELVSSDSDEPDHQFYQPRF
jgi:hypothetical protein